MGSQTKYAKKDLVYVPISIGEADEDGVTPERVKYGFFTNIPAGNRTDLGHIAIAPETYADPPDGLVMGCSFPQPRRASRREALRFTSSFVAITAVSAAKKKGYRITRFGKVPPLKLESNTRSFVQTVHVGFRGIKYAWNIPKVSFTNAGDLSAIGVEKAVASDRDELCFGASFPRPPRASKLIEATGGADGVKTITTFFDPDKDLTAAGAAGWTDIGGGKYSL